MDLNNCTILTTHGKIRCHTALTFDLLDDEDNPTGYMRLGWVDRQSLTSNTTNDSLYMYISAHKNRKIIDEDTRSLLSRIIKTAPEHIQLEYNKLYDSFEIQELITSHNSDPPIITKTMLADCLINLSKPVLKKRDIFKHEYIRFLELK
jgi:hypothetical protein